jgi:hypothetical protein
MLGGFLHICTCTCTIYCGLWPPDNTSCLFLTWYQSPGLGHPPHAATRVDPKFSFFFFDLVRPPSSPAVPVSGRPHPRSSRLGPASVPARPQLTDRIKPPADRIGRLQSAQLLTRLASRPLAPPGPVWPLSPSRSPLGRHRRRPVPFRPRFFPE